MIINTIIIIILVVTYEVNNVASLNTYSIFSRFHIHRYVFSSLSIEQWCVALYGLTIVWFLFFSYKASWWQQASALYWRCMLSTLREPAVIWSRFVPIVVSWSTFIHSWFVHTSSSMNVFIRRAYSLGYSSAPASFNHVSGCGNHCETTWMNEDEWMNEWPFIPYSHM